MRWMESDGLNPNGCRAEVPIKQMSHNAGDIGGHPVWNLRAKTPQQEQATVPWHQVLQNIRTPYSCSTLLNSSLLSAWTPLSLHWKEAPAKRDNLRSAWRQSIA